MLKAVLHAIAIGLLEVFLSPHVSSEASVDELRDW
jgi:hypothetical protein